MNTLKTNQVNNVFENGQWAASKYIKAIYTPSDSFSYMVTAPKKTFKKAVDRNKIKRLMRNAIQENQLSNVNICFIYSTDTILDFNTINTNIKSIFNKIKL